MDLFRIFTTEKTFLFVYLPSKSSKLTLGNHPRHVLGVMARQLVTIPQNVVNSVAAGLALAVGPFLPPLAE